jgi:hypothetical protein
VLTYSMEPSPTTDLFKLSFPTFHQHSSALLSKSTSNTYSRSSYTSTSMFTCYEQSSSAGDFLYKASMYFCEGLPRRVAKILSAASPQDV